MRILKGSASYPSSSSSRSFSIWNNSYGIISITFAFQCYVIWDACKTEDDNDDDDDEFNNNGLFTHGNQMTKCEAKKKKKFWIEK